MPTTTETFPWLKNYPEGAVWDQIFEPMPLYALFDTTCARIPDQVYLSFFGRKFTYREIDRLIDRACLGFRRLGVEKGVKVGLYLPNCPQYVIAFFAILKAGGTVVNFSPLYAVPELLEQVEDSHTDVMVTLNLKALFPNMERVFRESRLKHLVVGTMSEVLPFPQKLLFPVFQRAKIAQVPKSTGHLWFRDLIAETGSVQPVEIDPENDLAVLQYTGGTTGVPKGAMLSHANLSINARQLAAFAPERVFGADRILGVLPLFHVFAMTSVLTYGTLLGAEIILHPRFDTDAVLKDIERRRPTLMPGVPTMFTALNHHPRIATYDLSALQVCNSGGAPMPIEVMSRFEELSGCQIAEGYGLTECAPVATANPAHGLRKAGSIGLPMPATRLVITDREHPHRVLPWGETGEICIEGPQVMKGYWRQPEATADTLLDGRLHTGDVGYMDDDGYTFIIDRMKDMILASGYNVYPRHVEEAIYQHPAVAETTVIGIPDAYRGESPKAFVVLKDVAENLTEAELLAFLAERLGKHELPVEIEFRAELPKTAVGKLSKKELIAEEAAKRAGAPENQPDQS